MEKKIKVALAGGLGILVSLVMMSFTRHFNDPFLPALILMSVLASGLPIPKNRPVLKRIAFFFSVLLYLHALYFAIKYVELSHAGETLAPIESLSIIVNLAGAALITTVLTLIVLERPVEPVKAPVGTITPPGFFKACLIPLKKYKDFEGRAGRREYWGFSLLTLAVLIPLNFLAAKVLNDNPIAKSSREIYIWYIAVQLFLLTPSWAAFARRMHDTGRSGWMWVLSLIPVIGHGIIIGFLFKKGDPGPNKYGNNPHLGQEQLNPNTNDFLIHSDPSLFNLPLICNFLRKESYWATDRSVADIEKSIEHSHCFGGYLNGKQIAFARVITDNATFYYIADVFLLPEFQNNGYGTQLINHILETFDVDGMRGLLFTKTAQEFYGRHGFIIPSDEDRGHIMIRKRKING